MKYALLAGESMYWLDVPTVLTCRLIFLTHLAIHWLGRVYDSWWRCEEYLDDVGDRWCWSCRWMRNAKVDDGVDMMLFVDDEFRWSDLAAAVRSWKNWWSRRWKKLKDPAWMTKSSHCDPHGRCQLTRVSSANVLDEGIWIGGKVTTDNQRFQEWDWHTMYPSLRPRGGGSLHTASNLVYDHNDVYMVPP
jgi:hypothetical protein